MDHVVPGWLEAERKEHADEVAQLKAKVLTSRREARESQRTFHAKLTRTEEALRAALAELEKTKRRAVVAEEGQPASSPSVDALTRTDDERSSKNGSKEGVSQAAVALSELDARDMADVRARARERELEARVAASAARAAATQKDLETLNETMAAMAAEKAKATTENQGLRLLVDQLRRESAHPSTGGDDQQPGRTASPGLSSRAATTSSSSSVAAQADAAELRAENERLRRELESAREELASARRSSRPNADNTSNSAAVGLLSSAGGAPAWLLGEPTPAPSGDAAEHARQLNLARAAAASEQAMLRQEIARLKAAAVHSTAAKEEDVHSMTQTRRALEAQVRDQAAELGRERERRADAERKLSVAEARAATAAEGLGIQSRWSGGTSDAPPPPSNALMTAALETQGDLANQVAILRDRLAAQQAGLETERASTVAQIRALNARNDELARELALERKKPKSGGWLF